MAVSAFIIVTTFLASFQAFPTFAKPHIKKASIDSKLGDSSCSTTACVEVYNGCGMTLYLDRTNIDDENSLNVFYTTPIDPGVTLTLDISAWVGLTGQRLYAWWEDPVKYTNLTNNKYADKVEINVCQTDPITFCYNPTAVDYFALPVSIGPGNNDDCPDVPATGTPNFYLKDIKAGCPTVYESAGNLGTCRSAYDACTNYEPNATYCDNLRSSVDTCIKDGVCPEGTTTVDAYGCAGYFADEAGYCASLNRGVYPNLDEDDSSVFYENKPYNEYSAWIHTNGALEYGFPYDDYGSSDSSGYNSCTTNILSVKWCPVGYGN